VNVPANEPTVPLIGDAGRRSLLSTAALIVTLLAYSNLDAWRSLRTPHPMTGGPNFRHMTVLALVVAWARVERLTPYELGLSGRALLRSVVWGVLVGVTASIPVRVFFAFPLVSRDAITQPEFLGLSVKRLLWLLTAQFFISTAVFEEVAFRGVLHAKLVKLIGVKPALFVGSGVFAAWHCVITWYNLTRSNLPRGLFWPLYVGAMLVLGTAGMMFGLLRLKTGHLAAGIFAHWLIVVNIVVAVARPRSLPKVGG
jgi:membrane protease YdiL (CAAX protease family)